MKRVLQDTLRGLPSLLSHPSTLVISILSPSGTTRHVGVEVPGLNHWTVMEATYSNAF